MSWNTIEVATFNAAFTLVGALVAHRLNLGRERRQAVREFRRKIGVLRSKIERQPGDGLATLYNLSVPGVQGDVLALKTDLWCWRYQSVRSASNAFSSIPHSEVNVKAGDMNLARDFESGRKRILDALDVIEKAL